MSNQQPSSDRIPLREILRAIFMPAEEAQDLVISDAFALNSLRQRFRPVSFTNDSEQKSNSPAVIEYKLNPITPAITVDVRRAIIVSVGTLLTIGLAFLAQSALKGSETGSGALAITYITWLLLIVLLYFEFAPPDAALLKRGPLISGRLDWTSHNSWSDLNNLYTRIILAIIGLGLCVLTYFLTAGNLFRPLGVITWILAISAWMITLSERRLPDLLLDWRMALQQAPNTLRNTAKPRLVPIAAFLIIMGAAVFFRAYRLDAVPYQMTSDHVEKLLDAYDVSQGIYHVFFTRNGGREAIQFYLVAIAADVFGTGMSFITLKLVSVLEGLALIPLLILFGREVVDTETGFYLSALVAVSWWHTALSRLSLRIVLTPFFVTIILILLIRGIRTGSRRTWLWAGFWMGLGVYGYQAMRIVPLVAIAAALVSISGPVTRAVIANLRNATEAPHLWITASRTLSRQINNLLAAGVIAAAFFIPMLRVWHDFPTQLWNRVVNRTTETEVALQGAATEIFLNNYGDTLRMFNVAGDVAWISAVPGEPMMSFASGALFLLGVAAWAVRIFLKRDPVDVFLIAAALILLLPSALAIAFPIENPSVTRASGVIPIVFLIAAWPLSLIRQKWVAVMGRIPSTLFGGGLIAALILGSSAYNYEAYFTRYDRSYRDAALNPGQVASAVRMTIGDDNSLDGVWLVGWPFWHDYRAIGIEAGDITFNNAVTDTNALRDHLSNFPELFSARPLVFIVHSEDEASLRLLNEWYPAGAFELNFDPVAGKDFYLYVVDTN